MIIYCIYIFITASIVFLFHNNNEITFTDDNNVDRFLGDETSEDRIVLLEDEHDSGIVRIDVIEKAEETLDIAYYTTHKGISREIFFGSIVEAADRGVEIRILIDGIFHNLRGPSRDFKYMLKNHPNIELKFYEPLNLIKPWTWNNRLHDKHIIADNKYAIIGGRNIGDKYFLKNYDGDIVKDRDVLILNTNPNNNNSVIKDMKSYFNMVWNHEFSQECMKDLNYYQIKIGEKKESYLSNLLKKLEYSEEKKNYEDIDWYSRSVPTNNITFIHNPIERFNKDPRVLQEIAKVMEHGEDSIFIQSPYVIPIKHMTKHINIDKIKEKEVSILTNSLATSPNYIAMAGYENNRKKLINHVDNVYEYQGDGSIHGKSIIVDDRISLIGSFNIDPRSSFLNTESMVVIDSEEFSNLLKEEVNNIVDSSLLVNEDYGYEKKSHLQEKKAPKKKKFTIKLLQVFVYFFQHLI